MEASLEFGHRLTSGSDVAAMPAKHQQWSSIATVNRHSYCPRVVNGSERERLMSRQYTIVSTRMLRRNRSPSDRCWELRIGNSLYVHYLKSLDTPTLRPSLH